MDRFAAIPRVGVSALGAAAAVCIFAACPHKVLADEVTNVDAPLCKQISSKVAELTHANFDHFGPKRTGVFFNHPYAANIVVDCSSRTFFNVYINTESPYPNDLWFSLASLAAGAITTSPPDAVESSLRKCQKAALLDESGVGYAELINAHIECYAKTDPPESSIYIFLRDAENNKILGQPD